MREWCQRRDFRALLPRLLVGEDAQFADYIRALAARESPADADEATNGASARPLLRHAASDAVNADR